MFSISEIYGYISSFICCFLYYRLVATSWQLLLCIKNFGISRIWKLNLKKEFGPWAVVTGSTDGIGKAYAHELAKRGINIFLISRSMEKLEAVSADIKSKHGVETEVLQIDFSSKENIYDKIEEKLSKIEIGILVNNVGVSYDTLKSFEHVTEKEISHLLSVNMGAPTFMTKIVVPSMIKRKKGAIINISSMGAVHPTPHLCAYSASKAYNRFFSTCLGEELKDITVQTITPWYVSTNMVSSDEDLSKPCLIWPSPETFAASALSTFGYTDYTSGYIVHELFKIILCNNITEWMYVKLNSMCNIHYINSKKRR